MKFSEYAKGYILNGSDDKNIEITKDKIYDLKDKISMRLEFLLPLGYYIVGNIIVYVEERHTDKLDDETVNYVYGELGRIYEERRLRIKSYRRNKEKVEQMKLRGLKKNAEKAEDLMIFDKGEIQELGKEADRLNVSLYDKCSETEEERMNRSLYRDVTENECILFDLLLDNIAFKGNGGKHSGRKLRWGEWETIDLQVRKEIFACIELLSDEFKERWPFEQDDLEEIRMKLFEPQKYRCDLRRIEVQKYLNRMDIIELLDEKELDKILSIFSKHERDVDFRKDIESIQELYAKSFGKPTRSKVEPCER